MSGEYSPASPRVIALSIGKSEAERIRESVQYIRHKKSRRHGARRAGFEHEVDDDEEEDSDYTASSRESSDASEVEGNENDGESGDDEEEEDDEEEGLSVLHTTKPTRGDSVVDGNRARRPIRRRRRRRASRDKRDDAEEYESDPYTLITILIVWSLLLYYLLQTQYIGRLLIEVARPLIILATVRPRTHRSERVVFHTSCLS